MKIIPFEWYIYIYSFLFEDTEAGSISVINGYTEKKRFLLCYDIYEYYYFSEQLAIDSSSKRFRSMCTNVCSHQTRT